MYDNYYDDHRVRAGVESERGPIKAIDEKRMVATIVLENDDGEEVEYELPVTYQVCPTCDGKGTHVNPSIDCNGLTASDFNEDPDFAEAYIGGVYDVACYGCQGKRVVPQIDRDRADKDALKMLDDHNEAERQFREIERAERRMGC